MIHWLYRYVFRGIGFLLVVGMITILYLAINSQKHKSAHHVTHTNRGGEQ